MNERRDDNAISEQSDRYSPRRGLRTRTRGSHMEARDSRNSATLTGSAASRRFVGANITLRGRGCGPRGSGG